MLNSLKKRISDLLKPSDFVTIKYGQDPPVDPTGNFIPYYLNKEIEGVKFKFFIGDIDGKQWYHTGCTDPDWPEMRFIRDHMLEKGDTVIECGSHQGCTAILLSNWVGKTGKVFAFEPNPSNFQIARTNISINLIKNVELIQSAVGRSAGEIKIDVSSSNSLVILNSSGNNRCDVVKSIDLDTFAKQDPDFIKIDVEGFELDVLIGSKRILKKLPKLAIEVHTEQLNSYNASVDSIFNAVGRENYNFWIQWTDDQMPVPYQFEKVIDKRVHLFALPKI